MNGAPVDRVVRALTRHHRLGKPLSAHREDPYRVLVACLISLRTKDEVTDAAAARLFAVAADPAAMVRLRASRIEGLIYPAGFYRTKAGRILEISRILLERHAGRVPDTIDGLLELPGVGRKTANLTVTLGYGKPGICVDTHVHRISNRLGWVDTKRPDDTEEALRRTLPRRYWIPINALLVRHGREICHPTSPWCSRCPVAESCPRRGVLRSR